MRQIIISVLLIFTLNIVFAQEKSYKEQSIEQFKDENYPLAIDLMEKALTNNPNDAEIYYYLGFFNHFNAYDSRPLKGYDSTYSRKTLNYFDKALELNPNFGNAKAFYFTECSAAASREYKNNNLLGVKGYFEKAYKKGVIPEWGFELGKNMLNSCEKNAILFTHGDFARNICLFTQLHYDYRNDISVIPLALLDRPSYDLVLNNNKDSNILRGVDLGLTSEQILDMHPYKWDTITISLPIPSALSKLYSISKDYTMDWIIEPDLYSEREVARIDGAKSKKQAYLSPTRAMLLSIVETNKWARPIYFTNTFETYYLAGLKKYFQNCGLVSKLTPIKTKDTPYQLDVSVLETLVLTTKLDKLKTIINNDQPRVSNSIGLYQYAYYFLAKYYAEEDKQDELATLIEKYKQNLMIDFEPEYEKKILEKLEEMKK